MKNKSVETPMSVSVRYTAEEYDLLEGVFNNNPFLLHAVKKSMLQYPLLEAEEHAIMQHIKGNDLRKLLRKIILPTYADDEPINWMEDPLERLGGVNMPFDVRTPENGALCVRARLRAVEYIRQEIDRLFTCKITDEVNYISLRELEDTNLKDDKKIYQDYLTRIEIVDKVKDTLNRLKTMSVGKPTQEQIDEYIKKNSTK